MTFFSRVPIHTMVVFISLILAAGQSLAEPVNLRLDPSCIFKAVAAKKHITLRPEIPEPKVYLASQIALSQFQDAFEKEYPGVRPDLMINIYFPSLNEIYIVDDASHYPARERFLEDVFAHEFVHFFQVKYDGWEPGPTDPENEAVQIQFWFRDTYLLPQNPPNPCEAVPEPLPN